jgi:hypothetical protein
MGSRGPQPKGEYGGKVDRTAVFSTRLQKDTRVELENAANTSGRSLSQELEHRLRRTFREDDWEIRLYGSKQNAAVVNLIGAAICSAAERFSAKRKHDWLKEQWLFDDVMDAIAHTLLWFRPGGDTGRREVKLSSGTDRAQQLINEIRAADPALPINKQFARQHDMARLKDKLGDLVRERNPYDDLWRPKVREPTNISPRLKRKLRKRT